MSLQRLQCVHQPEHRAIANILRPAAGAEGFLRAQRVRQRAPGQ